MVVNDISLFLDKISTALYDVLFFNIYPFNGGKVPALIFFIFVCCAFFLFYLKFVNFRHFKTIFGNVLNTNNHSSDSKQISSRAAFLTGISGAIGLGSISGVAIALKIGGPGAIFWLIISGIISMPLRFAEVFLGHKYRKIDEKTGQVLEAGPFAYIKYGLAEVGLKKFGLVLTAIFAATFVICSLGGPSSFQVNQAVATVTGNFFEGSQFWAMVFSGILTFVIAAIILGGIKRIAGVSSVLIMMKSGLYLFIMFLIIALNITKIPETFTLIMSEAFSLKAGLAGLFTVIMTAFTRAIMTSEVGLGSVPIVHANTSNKDSVLEGLTSMSGPVFANVIFCFLNGFTLVLTGAYQSRCLQPEQRERLRKKPKCQANRLQ
jgi:AGCS family alanine or glycine:cation symporter